MSNGPKVRGLPDYLPYFFASTRFAWTGQSTTAIVIRMFPAYSSPLSHPRKKRRLSSPRRYYPSGPSFQSPSLSTLAEDRHVSRQKLQSTWEDIIQKYSALASDEADEIDLETGEIIIDHGHLKSLHDSTLWDPQDSERESENDESDVEIIDRFPVKSIPSPKREVNREESLPAEEEIIQRFGEQYGRDILSYLRQRTSTNRTSSKAHLWSGPEGEAQIFERAKEKWKEWRAKPAQQAKERQFDKESFEKAVFGALTGARRSAFEEAVFGQVKQERDEDDEGTGFDGDAAFEQAVYGQRVAFKEENKEREIIDLVDEIDEEQTGEFDKLLSAQSDGGVKIEKDDVDVEERENELETIPNEIPELQATEGEHDWFIDEFDDPKLKVNETIAHEKANDEYDIFDEDQEDEINDDNAEDEMDLSPARTKDIIDLITPSPRKRSQTSDRLSENRRPTHDRTPTKRTRTPSSRSLLSSTLRRTAQTKDNARKNVVSGLIIDASDEEDDFFLLTSSARALPRSKTSTPKSLRQLSLPIDSSQSVTILSSDDTKGKCGDKGYRCTKAFCFSCIP